MKVSEYETTINLNGDHKTAEVYSCHPVYMGRLKKAAEMYPNEVKLIFADRYGVKYSMPVEYMLKPTIRPPKTVSETQRAMARQNMLNLKRNKMGA